MGVQLGLEHWQAALGWGSWPGAMSPWPSGGGAAKRKADLRRANLAFLGLSTDLPGTKSLLRAESLCRLVSGQLDRGKQG